MAMAGGQTSGVLDDIFIPAAAGVAAGLGVAMPLGAIAALLLREGLVNGLRVAAAGAAGVAAVDTAYCTLAVLTGAAMAPLIESHRLLFLTVSGGLVITIGARQLSAALRRRRIEGPEVNPTTARRAFARFVGLTAINPVTLVYFVALAGAVTSRTGSAVGPTVFVLAVGLSSLSWQLILAAAGAWFGRSLSMRTVEGIGILASVLIMALGVVIVMSGQSVG
jgi:threonine/homoserine/homoserine lactone efflux protein